MTDAKIIHGNALLELPKLADASVDCVVSDPPYAEVDRPYGRLTEAQWHTLMDGVVAGAKRVLKPTGSAVFILQANSEHVGKMRLWLWEWMLRAAKSWNLVQDAYWWNTAAVPTKHVNRSIGLCRPSVKMCVWLGSSDCYRDQASVLWSETQANVAARSTQRIRPTEPYYTTSGGIMNKARSTQAAEDRGGVTPYNLLPFANTNSSNSSGSKGHGGGTPFALCEWWVKYLCPPGGVVLDMFNGAGTAGIAAVSLGRNYIGIEQHAEYCEISRKRIASTCRPKLYGMIPFKE